MMQIDTCMPRPQPERPRLPMKTHAVLSSLTIAEQLHENSYNQRRRRLLAKMRLEERAANKKPSSHELPVWKQCEINFSNMVQGCRYTGERIIELAQIPNGNKGGFFAFHRVYCESIISQSLLDLPYEESNVIVFSSKSSTIEKALRTKCSQILSDLKCVFELGAKALQEKNTR